MKEVLEVRANTVYTQVENKLSPRLELILIHTAGKQYEVKAAKVTAIPIINEARFSVNSKQLDDLIADLQKWKLQMVTIEQNCSVLNHVISITGGKESEPTP